MRKEEYLKAITAGIESEIQSSYIKAELNAHIDDKIEYFMSEGLSEVEAEEKAVVEMGEADGVATDLAKLHESSSSVFCGILICISLIAAAPLNIFYMIFGGLFDYGNSLDPLFVFAEFFYLLFLFLVAYISRRKLKALRCGFTCVSFFLLSMGTLYITFANDRYGFCSPIVSYTYCIITGKADAFSILPYAVGVEPSFRIIVLHAVFYLFIFVLLYLNFYSINNLSNKYYSLSDKRIGNFAEKAIKFMLIFLTAFIVVFCILLIVAPADYKNQYQQTPNKILFAQNDSICDVEEIYEENKAEFSEEYHSLDVFPYFAVPTGFTFGSCEYTINDIDYNGILTYKITEYSIDVKPKKEYVFVGMYDDNFYDEKSIELEEWKETNRQYNYRVPLGNSYFPDTFIEITIHEKQE